MKYLILFTSLAAILLLTNPIKWKYNMDDVKPKNVLGTELRACSNTPMTGFYRDGSCNTGYEDYGVHVVCAEVTEEFLAYTKSLGNDLSTPLPAPSTFPGLKPGDRWCLCGSRWQEAYEAGYAPKVVLESTHEKALEFTPIEILKANAAD
jgi:uncharacterized protein (DUF2237 family)